jgi:hypothetical protein
MPRPSHAPLGCHRLYPGRDAAALPRLAGGAPPPWPQAWRPRAWYHGRWPQRWPRPAGRHPLRRPGYAVPLFPAVGGIAAYQVAPQAGLAHSRIGRLPLPIDAVQGFALLHQRGPDALKETALAQLLEVAVHRAVVTELFRQLVPLAASPQAKEDAVQHPPQVHPPRPFGLGGIVFVQDRLEHRPHIVWDLPDGRHWLMVGLWSSHGLPPLCEEGYRQGFSFD